MSVFLNLIFPEKNICFVCGEYGKDILENLCSICRNQFVFIDRGCSVCGRGLLEDTLDSEQIIRCAQCIKHPHYFKKSISVLSYEGNIRNLIHRFKYSDHSHMYKMFGRLMVKTIRDYDFEYVDLVVPIPLHLNRLKKRGYNQAELLASYIGKELDLKVDSKALVRQKETSAQNKLSKSDRAKNIEGVFNISDNFDFLQKKILLIDDIYTTGSTVDECSKVMLEHGAGEIFVATLAATPNNQKK